IPRMLERVNLVELISQDVRLRKNGNNWIGLCPFHSDNKPSFSVSPSKGLYYCFGCHAGGNALTYMKEARGHSFGEAVQELARLTGTDLPDDWGQGASAWKEHREKKDLLFEINEAAALWFTARLHGREGSAARSYLEGRRLDGQRVTDFGLGYAPPEGGLHRELAHQGKSVAAALELGLLWQASDDPRKIGDRFRGRVVFPIRDLSGHVAGFSARAMEKDQQPKYINSSESLVFHKGELLYGLWEARDAIRKRGEAVLVEGQMDALAMHRAGMAHAVAPMGTALTEQQVRLLARFTGRLVVMFDGDSAGLAAAEKALRVLLPSPLRGSVVTLPEGEDPDSLLNTRGAAALQDAVTRGTPWLEWLVRQVAARHEDSMSGRAAAMREGGTWAALLADEVERGQFLEQLASAVGIDPPPRSVSQRSRAGRPAAGSAQKRTAVDKNQLDIVALLIHYPHLLRRVQDTDRKLEDQFQDAVGRLIRRLLDQFEETGTVVPATLLGGEETGELGELLALAEYEVPVENAEDALAAKLDKLHMDRLRERKEQLLRDHRRAELQGDGETRDRLARELETVLSSLRALKQGSGR
ncbi:MAG: DNA primase, partial [Deltaproteobacteria bacterium]|nr:DNA primase [Deltaproteobacteria bacterium]